VFLGAGVEPLTHAFTNNTSVALDHIPANQCKFNGMAVKTDARGVPRPVEDGCDAGAVERVNCGQTFVSGAGARIGTPGNDEISGSNGVNSILALGGNDEIRSGGDDDAVCAGGGKDEIFVQAGNDYASGGPGTDLLNYNDAMAPGGGVIDLGLGTANGATIGSDLFDGIENAQGTEGSDEIIGSDGPNLLIGGGDDDNLEGRGGIDILDAKDGEADDEINCGPGKNSKEKAKIDQGIDPEPVSC
jgi:Ca2+-binding RTX toxin-like protein